VATPNANISTGDTLIGPRRDYRVQFTNAGTYYVWVRLLGVNGSDDSVHVGLNGAGASLGGVGVSFTSPAWTWVGAVTPGRVMVNVAAPGAATVTMRYDDFSRLGIWSKPHAGDFVCLEPWTAALDALNTGEGLTVLPPGAAAEGWVDLTWRG
jgi:hypothetical protein